MSPIQDLKLIYTFPNKEKIFSEGNNIVGKVTFTLTKPLKVKSIIVKVKGDARVDWTEGSGDDETSYTAHRRYFKLKECLVSEGVELPQGKHLFKFKLTIPGGDMPSSFKGSHGKIVYMIEAKISRSWRWPSVVQDELNFVSQSSLNKSQAMCPHTGSVGKEVGVFSKGQVQLTATVDRKVCTREHMLSIVAKIRNFSSKKMRPKFSFQQKIVYRASGSTKTHDQSLCKMSGEVIKGNSERTVTCRMKIPDDVLLTLSNCEIISVEHYLKVYLDISFAFDPEVRFPLIIVPSKHATPQPRKNVEPCPAEPVEAPSSSDFSDFPPPDFPPPPLFGVPGAYGYPTPDFTQHVNTASGSNPQWQQQVTPHFLSNPAFLPLPPSAPFLFPQEPPSYSSLFPDSNYTNGGSEPEENSELQKEKI
ncbi:arrestin domain-containing protein 3-like [Antennarius striatus]|uniref:arrestin domain-containing protein 3-like n=1 Tax=Antennarius striatus TaxID=241820 RepID=UPI0035B4C803